MGHQRFDIVPSHQVDAAKWDDCIVNSISSKIYAKYIYLQHIADNWSGLVMNDYDAVMPIVWRKKWGIRYAYDALFIQQLGLFGTYDAEDLKNAIKVVMRYAKYGDLFFNHTNPVLQFFPGARTATNLIIPLHIGYEPISKSYNNHLKNNLKKAALQSLQYTGSDDVELAVQTYRQLYAQRFPASSATYQRLTSCAKLLLDQQQCFIRKVADKENNLIAIALFLKGERRVYNILPSTTEKGRKLSAMHYLIDNVIQEFAGAPLVLDFEGSDVPGIKAFYQSFGAIDEPYFHLHYNRLPVPIRWLKR